MLKLDRMKVFKTCRVAAIICFLGFMARSYAQEQDEQNFGNKTTAKANITDKTTAEGIAHQSKPTIATSSMPDIVITDKDKHTCLLASFNVVFSVDYTTNDVDTNQTYADTAEIELTLAGSKASGNCSSNQSVLSVRWRDPVIRMLMTFSLKKSVTDYWVVTSLSLEYDTSNSTIFPNAKSPGLQTIEDRNITLFATPVNQSYTCAVGQDVDLIGDENDATVTFTDLQLQVFGTNENKFSAGLVCPADFDASKMKKVEIIIPLAVAGCLTLVVLVVIVGYIVSRQSNLSMSNYKSMG